MTHIDQVGSGVEALDTTLDVRGMHIRPMQSVSQGSPIEGVELIEESLRIGGGGHRIAFVHPRCTDGILIELIEDPSAPERRPVASSRRTAPVVPVRPRGDRGSR